MSDLTEFRADTRAWLQENLPEGLVARGEEYSGGTKETVQNPDTLRWFESCYEQGWTVPSWPKEFGGAELSSTQAKVLQQEMAMARAPTPLSGMGVTMIGPTLLEHGTDDQKSRHLRSIANGKVRWCQGYSEPNAGSDLASLQTRAVDQGDYYLINGSKIWTSGANFADWIFCLVRTNTEVPKHDGISFVLFSMDDPGVSIKPIVLIAGNSPFCQCFFDDVKVPKTDLIGEENRGWTVAKRLLQHERSMISGMGSLGGGGRSNSLAESALSFYGKTGSRIADANGRETVSRINMDRQAFSLTQRRAIEENTSGSTPTFATSMFKYYATELDTRRMEALIGMRGSAGIGWQGDVFDDNALNDTRSWLFGKAGTIAGGSSEVQLNIIAKRVLGLPD